MDERIKFFIGLDTHKDSTSVAACEASREPSLVRGVVFELLRTGGLCAPALHTQPLSLHTLLEPGSWRLARRGERAGKMDAQT